MLYNILISGQLDKAKEHLECYNYPTLFMHMRLKKITIFKENKRLNVYNIYLRLPFYNQGQSKMSYICGL